MTILVTGAAGFIGYHLCKKLLTEGFEVFGIDNMNEYYDVALKNDRLNELLKSGKFSFNKLDISNKNELSDYFGKHQFTTVINLAAQAGVRYSLINPDTYIESNIVGFFNVLECCKNTNVKHLIFASSSSVYGDNTKIPYSTEDKTDSPVSLYAATKKCDELIAYSYSKLYGINITGLRFFTVYGPYGRPDMAYFSFTNKFVKGDKIKVFNYGNCKRDFTYVDDVVSGIYKILMIGEKEKNHLSSLNVPFKVYNIGNNTPVNLIDFINILCLDLKKHNILDKYFDVNKSIELVPMQKGDVPITYADTSELEKDFGYKPSTSLVDGLDNFASWYKEYYLK